MSKEERLLEFVLDEFSNIREVLNATKDIENFLIKLKLNRKRGIGVILEKTKKLVDSLHDRSEKVNEEFYKQYKLLESLAEKDECSENTDENTVNGGSPLINTENLENGEDELQRQVNDNSKEQHNNTTSDALSTKQNENKSVNEENENNPEDSLQSPDIIDSSIHEENKDEEKESSSKDQSPEENRKDCKSVIRLVDLNKLIDPKQKKSVKFDSSIIILTSSDEETKTPKKTCDTKDDSGILKSALKHVSSPLKIKESKSKFNDKSSKKTKDINTSSDESSDSDIQEINQVKNKTKRSSDENSDKSPSKKPLNSNKSDDNSDSDSDVEDKQNEDNRKNNVRKSGRIQTNKISKETERAHLRKLFHRKLSRSATSSKRKENSRYDNSSDSESNSGVSRKLSGKNKNLVEKHLSDSSSLSSNESGGDRTLSKNKKIKRNIKADTLSVDDKKFKYEVYIPLPRIECSRLKEIYLKNKDIFDIKRPTDSNYPTNQKRSLENKSGNSQSSSDSDKPKNKKSKTVKVKDKVLSHGDSSSDDESPQKSTNDKLGSVETDSNLKENTENNDGHVADIEKLKEGEQKEKSQSSSSETEVEETNTKKKKKDDDGVKESNSAKNDNDNKEDKNDDASNSDTEVKKDKKKSDSDKALTVRLDSSDSEEESRKCSNKKKTSKEGSSSSDNDITSPISVKRKDKKRSRKTIVSSDSEGSTKDKNEDSDTSSKKDSSYEAKSHSESDSDSKDEEHEKKPVRKRIRRTKDSSSSSDDDKSTRKNIRRLIGRDSLSETTKRAEAEEKERKARIAEKQKKYNQLYELTAESKVDKVVLDYDEKDKKELLAVNKKIVKKLKPHQASGIQFMWDACFESVERARKTKGSGCILAHCMGLGKTLQVIALSHTLLTHEETQVRKIMVVCPVNTVLNWKSEFKKWMPKNNNIEVFELVSSKQNYEKQYVVSEWHNEGGVLIIGYTMFRNISNPDNKRLNKKMRAVFKEGLVDPGPDLVVCDEGHLLKNEKTHLSIAMNRIKTARRIVLTGTPLQNNLREYWCMVQFIKPNLLGTYKEYLNRFVNPIINGQYTDSTQHDIMLMRKRSHVLHKLLDGVVQRRDYGVLEPYLPPKLEYVLFIKLTETQVKLYKHYMEKLARKNDGSNKTSFLFADFQELQRICTHPRVLLDRTKERKEKEFSEEESEGSLKDFIDDGDESSAKSSGSSSSSGSNSDSDDSNKKGKKKSKGKQQKIRLTRAQAAQRRENNEESDPELEELQKEWFQEYCDGEELDNINHSGKLFLLFQILKECEEIGDKVLVFSQSLYTLNCIEYFLEKIDEATQLGNTEKVGGHSGSWAIGLDYFRLDGSSSCDNRATWCDMFNNPDNTRARLFLISTRAGGLGINLVAANRVIIFDVSWNPSHDVQSIYRVYRFGQMKPTYVYRFVTYGTMEMKIYERQVTKQAISKRVIDEQQIDRHYNQNDLQELYKCDLEPTDRPIPMVPKDVLLGELLQKYEEVIFKYHLHQSLLENKEDEGLNEEERKAAWEEFENEKVLRQNTGAGLPANARVNAQTIEIALANIVRKDNPTWSDVQIKVIIPALVQQLQVQLAEGDLTMYARVQQEIQLMQEMQAQKLREAYYQQQVMRMIQRQQQQAKLMGNLYVDPMQLARTHPSNLQNMYSANMNQGGPSTAPMSMSNEVIELND